MNAASTTTVLFLLISIRSFSLGFQTVRTAEPTQRSSFHPLSANNHNHNDPIDRRSAIASSSSAALAFPLLPFCFPKPANAATTSAAAATEPSLLTDPPLPNLPDPALQAPITHKVVFDVRISRQDGTFYVRDDLDAALPENRVFYGTLTFGLFGTTAPQAVARFLSYVDVPSNPLDDNPLPSYSRSSFVSYDQGTGLLTGGSIPSLEVTSFSGSTALKYGGRILPAPLWTETASSQLLLPHSVRGLLTHRLLDVSPAFGLTTRPCPELDGTHAVFGQLLPDDSSREFLGIVRDLPVYAGERPSSKDPREETAVDELAAAVFNSQLQFMRTAAKTLGDTRASKIYPGKLLRRVEVTKVTKL